jgi:hypothetical protein
MMARPFFAMLSAIVAVLFAGAGAPARASDTYTRNEVSRLGFCAGLTLNAKYIVEQKRGGRPAGEVKQQMQKNSAAELLVPLVDKVYAENVSSSWDYAGDFFDECALNMASVPRARVGMANFCMYNSLMAVTARQARDAGAPKEQAHRMVPFKSPTVDEIIDGVYAKAKGSGPSQLDAWNECIKVLTKG